MSTVMRFCHEVEKMLREDRKREERRAATALIVSLVVIAATLLSLTNVWSQDFPPGVYPGQERAASAVPAEASPTPYAEVVRVIGLLPKPSVGFIDYGCGDARWCIVAAEKWGCKCYGIEIDHWRAEAAKRRVAEAGLENLITIVEGDSTAMDFESLGIDADVAGFYLYPETITKLAPRIEKLKAFASYIHKPGGMSDVEKNGDSWVKVGKTAAVVPQVKVQQQRMAVWGNQIFQNPICSDPRCKMCNSIRLQLSNQSNVR